MPSEKQRILFTTFSSPEPFLIPKRFIPERNWVAVSVFLFTFLISFFSECGVILAQDSPEKKPLTESCSDLIAFISKSSGKIADSELIAPYVGKRVKWTGKVMAINDTLWGAEAGIKCSETGRKNDVTFSVGSKEGLYVGKQLSFEGEIDGLSEMGGILLRDAEIVKIPQNVPRPLPSPGIPPASPTETVPVPPAKPREVRAEQMKIFISDYFRANEKKDLGKVLSFYGDTVDYYSKGLVPKSYIITDKEIFFRSWGTLSYSLADDLIILDSKNSDRKTLIFSFEYVMQTSKKLIRATTKNTWEIENANTNPKIIAEKQTITSRHQF